MRSSKEYPNSSLLRDKTQHLQSEAWNPNHLFPIIGLKASIPLAHLGSLWFLRRSKLLPMHALFCKCSFSVWCWGVLSEVSSSEKHYLTLPVNITPDNPHLHLLSCLTIWICLLAYCVCLYIPWASPQAFMVSQRKQLVCLSYPLTLVPKVPTT